jgi:hypothetical protein
MTPDEEKIARRRAQWRAYGASPKGRARAIRYNRSEKGRARSSAYEIWRDDSHHLWRVR